MLWHLKGYQKSITLIKTGCLNKKNTNRLLIHKAKEKRQEEKVYI